MMERTSQNDYAPQILHVHPKLSDREKAEILERLVQLLEQPADE